MFPKMNKQPRRAVSVPDLAGGINLRDSLTTVRDNQLTDAVNMWFKDGALRTRYGFKPLGDLERTDNFEYYKTTRHGNLLNQGELISAIGGKLDLYNAYCYIWFYNITSSTIKTLPTFTVNQVVVDDFEDVKYFVVSHNSKLYLYIRITGNYNGNNGVYREIYTCDVLSPSPEWKKVDNTSDVKPYIPTVMTGGTTYDPTTYDNHFGEPFEGYNLIYPYYKMKVYPVDVNRDGATQALIYSLPFDSTPEKGETKSKFSGMPITIKFPYAPDKFVEHTAIYQDNGTATELTPLKYPNWKDENLDTKTTSQDGMYIMAKGSKVWLFSDGLRNFKEGADGYPAVDTSNVAKVFTETESSIENVLMDIIAPCEITDAEQDKVFLMNTSTWFGGASAGINGGTRLFLCDNEIENEKNLVLWSGLNDPLYFNENSYSYVGNKQEAVKAFGKQDDMLVIFKDNETYFTQYMQNNSITAEQLINQSVVDYSANSVFFPLTLIHADIGCDMPNSIQLCRNRLVWAHSNGKVYSLVTSNQYSERNVYEVGEMISHKLKNDIKNNSDKVCSADWNGYYVLQFGNKMYLMDYNSRGYQYAYSYQKAEDANALIPWYYWELSEDNNSLINLDGVLAFWHFDTEKIPIYKFEENADDNGAPIHSSLTTKLFDFDTPTYRKNVDSVQLMLGNNGGAPITATFVTDCGNETEEITLDGEDTNAYTVINAVALSPCIRSVLRFGVKLECEGTLMVDSIHLIYRILGGAR